MEVISQEVLDSTHLEPSQLTGVRSRYIALDSSVETAELDAERQWFYALSARYLQLCYGDGEPDYTGSIGEPQ